VPGNNFEPEALGRCIGPVTYNPKFHVQAIIYMPPGKQSSVSYATGSSEGSRVSVQTSTSHGNQVSASVAGMGGSTSYFTGVVNGHAISMNKTETFTRSETVNTGLDSPVRGSDVFDVWFNSKVANYYSAINGWEKNVWSTVGGAPPVVYSFTADELLGNAQVPQGDPIKYAYFLTLNSDDKAAILSMDAPLNSAYLDPRRYQLVDQQGPYHVMYGPDYAGAPIISYGYAIAYNKSYDVINGSFVNSADTVLAGYSIPVFSGQVSSTWTYNYSETRIDTTGAQKTATVTLRTPTVGCYMVTNMYVDAVFGTYLVLPIQSVSCD
jgi:hypothetical protein